MTDPDADRDNLIKLEMNLIESDVPNLALIAPLFVVFFSANFLLTEFSVIILFTIHFS